MAGRWRIRHKLMVGLGLVVGMMALLAAGTIHGMVSFTASMKTIESKLSELHGAEALRTAVADLGRPPDSKTPLTTYFTDLENRIDQVRTALKEYEDLLQITLSRHRDPDKGFNELGFIEALREKLTKLEKAREVVSGGGMEAGGSSESLIRSPLIQDAIREVAQTADDLRSEIYQEQYGRLDRARRQARTGIAVLLVTWVVGVLTLASLFSVFYHWVITPVRNLQLGVARVARGDFDHPIEVHSGDEMEDLAAAFNDMTNRLRTMYADLEQQVNDRSRQLIRSEQLASVGFLAAGVAHEINNPMASIAFCSEALESRLATLLATADPAERNIVTKYLHMIQNAAFRCKEITERLLEFSRGGEKRREPTDLANLVQGVLDLVQHLPNCKGKRIDFNPPEELIAWVNGKEISQVVLNLVVNALDSMDEGGRLTITLREVDGMAELVFADTGCGMPPEVLQNIFEPFFTRSRTGKGTGLGLSISHRLIAQHGGEIEAASPGPDQGSTFTVRLPLQGPMPADHAPGTAVRPQEVLPFGHAAA